MATKQGSQVSRRIFLLAAGSVAALPLVGHAQEKASSKGAYAGKHALAKVIGRRMLGKLEVSSVGLGVQNMSRTYQTAVPKFMI